MIENKIRISFILPCYNVEKFITECLNSLYDINIPENEYEIICVNDCSNDHTRKIIIEHKKYHSNLVLIDHDFNKKQGGARNTAIRNTKGDYIWFVDSDDYIKCNRLSELLNKCKNENLDILQFNYEKIAENGQYLFIKKNVPDSKVFSGVEFVNNVLGSTFLNYYDLSVCTRLYRTDFLIKNKIYFIENTIFEDLEFSLRTLLFSERIQSISDSYYCYRQNQSSTMCIIANDIRGDLIYNLTLIIGKSLIDLAKDIEIFDFNIHKQLFDSGIWRINQFTKSLMKMSVIEQNIFFSNLKNQKRLIDSLLPYFNSKNHFIIKHQSFSKCMFYLANPIIHSLMVFKH